jgi:hypothetical protein
LGLQPTPFVVESLEVANITQRCRKSNLVGGGYSVVLPNTSVCEVTALTTPEKSFEWLLREVSREGGDIRGVVVMGRLVTLPDRYNSVWWLT